MYIQYTLWDVKLRKMNFEIVIYIYINIIELLIDSNLSVQFPAAAEETKPTLT